VIQSYGEDTAPSSSLPGFGAVTMVADATFFYPLILCPTLLETMALLLISSECMLLRHHLVGIPR
jgi:hypothetical protein